MNKQSENIRNELKEIAPLLASKQKVDKPFKLPENYIENLTKQTKPKAPVKTFSLMKFLIPTSMAAAIALFFIFQYQKVEVLYPAEVQLTNEEDYMLSYFESYELNDLVQSDNVIDETEIETFLLEDIDTYDLLEQ